MAERVRIREISNEEGNRLLRIIRRSSGSVVTWRRAQMVLLSAQAMDAPQITRITFTSEARARDVIHNFNADGFDSLYPRYKGGRPPKFSREQRREIKRITLARPTDRGLPFSTWSLAKLAEHLVEEGVVEDISHEGLRALLREEGVSFQRLKTFKASTDPDFEAKKDRVLELYEIADGKRAPAPSNASWLNGMGPQFTALPSSALDGPDPPSPQEQGRMIRRYISWRNRNACDRNLREVVNRANVA